MDPLLIAPPLVADRHSQAAHVSPETYVLSRSSSLLESLLVLSPGLSSAEYL